MRLLEEYTAAYGTASVTMKAFLIMPSAEEPDLEASLLRVDVVEAVNFPGDIFVWEKQDTMKDDGAMYVVQRPVCVAKPSDLSVYPAGSPLVDPGTNPPYYRDSFLNFKITSPEIVVDTWAQVKADVSSLVKTTMELGGP